MKNLQYNNSLKLDVELINVIDAYDALPMITHVRISGQHMLQYWCDTDRELQRYLYLPVTESEVALVCSGEIELRHLFVRCTQPEGILFEDCDAEQSYFGRMSLDDALSENYAPEPGVKFSN